MGQGWSIGLSRAPLLLRLLSTTHNQPGDEVLAHQASAEESRSPFPYLGRESGAVGVLWVGRKSRGPPDGLTYSTEAEIKPL